MRYRLLAASGALLDEGSGTIAMTGGVLELVPESGVPLRIPPADVTSVSEPRPYTVHIGISDGARLELAALGAMRTQLLADLADARDRELPRALHLAGIGEAETFTGTVDGHPARLALHDDALVVVPDAGRPDKLPYPFLASPRLDGYRITIEVAGGAAREIDGLGRRTHEFLELLRERAARSASRTAHFLAALLPGLGPVAARSVAAQLRDGLAARCADLDTVDPTVSRSLLTAAALPERADQVSVLVGVGDPWFGVKQMVSVRRQGDGGGGYSPPPPPRILDHGDNGDALREMWQASLLAGGPPPFDAPFGMHGAALAYALLGTPGGGSRPGRGLMSGAAPAREAAPRAEVVPRAEVARGFARPESTDYAALSGGTPDEPAVLAFLLCRTDSGHLVYEALNALDHATYVYRARDDGEVLVINRALDLLGFRVSGIADPAAEQAGSAYRRMLGDGPPTALGDGPPTALSVLRAALVTRVIHGNGWAHRLRDVLATRPT